MKISIKYTSMQMLYWMIYSVAFGFVTYYLLGTGMKEASIGAVTAAGGIISALIQPLTGQLVDSGKIKWRTLLVILDVLCIIFNGIMLLSGTAAAGALSYAGFIAAVNLFVPISNGACFYYESRGEKINFGTARGAGSLCYGIMAYVLGAVSVRAGIVSVPAAGVLTSVLLLVVLLILPCEKEVHDISAGEKKNLFSEYPGFFAVVLGSTLCLSFHSISCNYLIRIVEECGGDSKIMGTAIAVAAVCELPAMFGFSRLSSRFSAGNLLKASAFCFILKSVMFLISSNVYMIYAAQVFQAGSFALMIPAQVFYSDLVMKPEDKMKGQAYMGLALTAGSFIGALSGGFLIQSMGVKSSLILGTVFTAAGFVLIAAGIKKSEKR